MPHIAIPNWTAQGFLPPVNPHNPTGSADRSPYKIDIVDLVLHFGTTGKRCAILQGFLRFRQQLHQLGLVNGFQWLDGSFMENIETPENRPPNDLDVVTFVSFPDGMDQFTLLNIAPNLFRPHLSKKDFLVDSHLVQLNKDDPKYLVERTRYWYSLWSHRRTEQWKGYIEVTLDSENDAIALKNLQSTKSEE